MGMMLAWKGRQRDGIAFGVHCFQLDRQMPGLLVNAQNVPLKYKIKHCSSDFNTRISASIDSEGLLPGCSRRGNRLFLRHLLPDDVQLAGCSQIRFSFDQADNVHKFTVLVDVFNAGIENVQPIEPVRSWDMARLCVVSRTPRVCLTFVLMQSSGYEMPCIPSCATLRMYSISVSKTKTVSTAQTIIATNRGCEVRFLADSLQRASNASPYVTVTDNDTPQCSYCFPEISRMMRVVPMTVMAKSQITAIGIPLRLASHATNVVGTCSHWVFQSSKLLNTSYTRKETFIKCTLRVQDGCGNIYADQHVARAKSLFRDQRGFLRTFSIRSLCCDRQPCEQLSLHALFDSTTLQVARNHSSCPSRRRRCRRRLPRRGCP